MRFHPLVLACLCIAPLALHGAPAEAQSATDFTFDSVTSYTNTYLTNSSYGFTVTGIQHGASAPSTVNVILAGSTATSTQALAFDSCERKLLVAINRPGRFSVGVASGTCTLTQLP